MTLEDLLRMEIKGVSPVSGEDIIYSPEFRVAIQNQQSIRGGRGEVHIIIHANGHNSTTLDFTVNGDELTNISS